MPYHVCSCQQVHRVAGPASCWFCMQPIISRDLLQKVEDNLFLKTIGLRDPAPHLTPYNDEPAWLRALQ